MSTSPSLGPLTHVSTFPEWTNEAKPQVTFYIGPTNARGRCPAVSQVTLTPVILFKTTFKDLQSTVGRFFNKELPVYIIGRTCVVTDDDSFVPSLNGCRFLHREVAGHHVLVRTYKDDRTIKEARKAVSNLFTLVVLQFENVIFFCFFRLILKILVLFLQYFFLSILAPTFSYPTFADILYKVSFSRFFESAEIDYGIKYPKITEQKEARREL